jgi:hypothetical protein
MILGLFGRLWYATHRGLESDQGVVGLMALNILHGHFYAFYWGQTYGGAEPYVVAAFFAVFGKSPLSLDFTPIVLVATASLLTWRSALRLVDDRLLAPMAGALVWIMPALGTTNTEEFGFRYVALTCGVGSILLALRILDGRRRYFDLVAFGLVVGLAWWASPESIYLLLPACALVIGAVASRPNPGVWFWLPRAVAAAGAGAVGALPWLWSNLTNGFQSINTTSLASPSDGTFFTRLQVFFVHALPLQLGLDRYGSGAPVIPGTVGVIVQALVEALVLGSVVLCLACPGRARAIGAGVVLFPLLYSVNPLAWYWNDGRYSVLLPPLLALTVVIACQKLFRLNFLRSGRGAKHRRQTRVRQSRALATAAVAVLLASVLALFGFLELDGGSSLSLSNNPNAATEHTVALLEQHHITHGYANYWVAYKIDYLSDGHLVFSPVPTDVMRSETLYRQASASPGVAWLFAPPSQLTSAQDEFGTTNVQTGFDPESGFLAALRARNDPYTIVHAGPLAAVIPSRPVTPVEAGMS